jgi:hypothetical protein
MMQGKKINFDLSLDAHDILERMQSDHRREYGASITKAEMINKIILNYEQFRSIKRKVR